MTAFTYRTIKSSTEGLMKERGSKFLSYAYPAANEVDIKTRLDELRNQYPDATHICYAWVLGVDGTHYRANDDGEPKDSAGQPILRAIKSLDLTHVLVAVVRYYGGKKLGVPGLIEAYGTGAKEALDEAEIVTKTLQHRFHLRHVLAKDYLVYEYANREGFEIVEAPSKPGEPFIIQIPAERADALQACFKSLPNFELSET